MPRSRSPHEGFSLIEMLLALAVIAVLAGVGLSAARPSLELTAARAVRSLILQARSQALLSGERVWFAQTPGGTGFSVGRSGDGTACFDGRVVADLRLSDFPGVRLSSSLWSGGLVWLPTGAGRTCDGGGVVSGTIELRGPFRGAAVVVSSMGRVRVEARP